jgi:hypothetical protein
MYVRPPENKKMKLPENYRGNAFGASGEYTDMPPPIRIPPSSYDIPPEDITERLHDEEKPDLSASLTDIVSRKSPPLPESKPEEVLNQKIYAAHEPKSIEKSNSIFSMLLPPVNNSSRFPFGHGIGAEELFILGMMLLAFSQGGDGGEVDNELILLLALLLFSG